MKKINFFIYFVIILICFIIFYLFKFNTEKTIFCTIISIDNSYVDIITYNDGIYRFNNQEYPFEVGDSIKIYYNGEFDNFSLIQDIDIVSIKKEDYNLNYSDKAFSVLSEMDISDKIGQLLLVRVPDSKKYYPITRYKIGGYILFQRDVIGKSKENLINDISSYQEISKNPLFIAIDEEGGIVSRLSLNKNIVSKPFLSPQKLYSSGGFEMIRQDAVNKTNLLSELGININLAPVADVATKKSSYMYERSFGENEEETAKYIETVLSTQTDNVSYVLKHFPGYGDNVDTHKGIAIDNRSFDYFSNHDFIPFIAGIKSGAKAIMISHNIVVNIENKPASISRNIHNVLRNYLSFNGVIITDDLSMGAIKEYSNNNSYVDAVLSGNNILIVTDYKTAYNEIYTAYIDNIISEELIDRLILKNIQLKIDMGLYN